MKILILNETNKSQKRTIKIPTSIGKQKGKATQHQQNANTKLQLQNPNGAPD